MTRIIFKTNEGEKEINAINGETLLEAANRNDVKLFGGCGGAGVCGTCHVFIDSNFIKKVNQKDDDEDDLIEILPNNSVNSRLACKITVSDDLDGMMVTIP